MQIAIIQFSFRILTGPKEGIRNPESRGSKFEARGSIADETRDQSKRSCVCVSFVVLHDFLRHIVRGALNFRASKGRRQHSCAGQLM